MTAAIPGNLAPQPPAPLRILFVFAWLVVGGEETEVRLLAENLDKPRSRANAAAEQVISTMLYLIPIFVLTAVTIAFLLVRNLRRPLRDLEGEALASGIRIVQELGLAQKYGFKG